MSNNLSIATFFEDISPLHRAYIGYVSRYEGNTRALYEYHLNNWFRWCERQGLEPLLVERLHIELFVRWRSEVVGNKPSTIGSIMAPIRGFYEFAVIDGIIPVSPATHVRQPRIHYTKKSPLSRQELGLLLVVARETSPRHWALMNLLGVMALRISEALSITRASCAEREQGYPVLKFMGKGSKPAVMPIPNPVMRALEAAAEASPSEFLIPTRSGAQLTRSGGAGLVDTVVRRAKLDKPVNPHLLRASVITQAFDAGLPGRDVQHLARHEDPRTTGIYDLGLNNHDRHAVHTLAARLSGG